MVDPKRGPRLVQAPVEPLDEDGVTAAVVGTIGFALAAVICWWQLDRLTARGQGWWLWLCVSGTVIGVLQYLYNRRRRSRRLAGHQTPGDEGSEERRLVDPHGVPDGRRELDAPLLGDDVGVRAAAVVDADDPPV